MTQAEILVQQPFFTACRDADQLAVRIKTVEEDSIWKFEDGSILTSYVSSNELEVLK
jgi:hypothetical protein